MEDDDSLYQWESTVNGYEYLYKLLNPHGRRHWCATINWYNKEFCLRVGAFELFPPGITRDEVKAYVLTLWRMR